MDFWQVAMVCLILFGGSLLQGAVGFAFNLITIPLLVQTGFDLSEAIAFITIPVTLQLILTVYQLKRHVIWPEVMVAAIIRLATLPLGMSILVFFDQLSKHQLQQILGFAVLFAVALQALSYLRFQMPSHPFWRYLAFAGSGLLQGAVSMGGPPAVLWAMAQPWTSQQTRAFLQAMFLVVSPFHIALLLATLGAKVTTPIWQGTLFTPVIFIGARLGVRLGNRMAKPVLRYLALLILALMALSSVFAPVL